MTLRLITGRARADKSAFILNEIKDKLTEDPLGPPIFYIVPEQMTFQLEMELLQDERIQGSIRAEVVSFSRLAFRVLQEMGGSTKQFIRSTGIQMMLRKIVHQRKEPFNVFEKASEKTGFIQEMEGMMTEFKRHCITPDLLQEHIAYAENNETLKNKLTDLHYIYAQLEEAMKGQYIDGEDQLRLLAENIPKAALFQGAEIYIDGFYRLTPNELQILAALLEVTSSVTFTSIMDEVEVMKQPDELDLFFQTTETFHTVKQLAQDLNKQVAEVIHLGDEEKGAHHDVFRHIEANINNYPAPTYHGEIGEIITLSEAIHPRAEMDGVVQEILRLIRDENYRLNDIVIYVRDSSTYHDVIQTIFQDYHIPVFIDEKRTMLNHPLIEFIRSFLDVIETNFRYDALFRLLKSGFRLPSEDGYPLTADGIDRLENYVLEYGIRHKKQWTQDEPWVFKRFRGFDEAKQTDKEKKQEAEINAYRNHITNTLVPFVEKMTKAKTVTAKIEVIYELLMSVQIPLQLEKQMEWYEEQGEVEKALEEEQVWNGVMQIMDEAVEMIGGEQVSLATFREMMEAGMEALQFSHVPPTLDHIIVASIDRSRIRKKKVAFLLGVNEGTWPMKPSIDGMINEVEREFLKQFGLRLAESNRRVLLDDTFYMYLAFTIATEKLWISYTISDHEGNAKSASPMISQIQTLFPELMRPILLQDPDDLQEATRFITTPSQTRSALTTQLARHLRGYEMDHMWWNVLDWYMENEPLPSTTQTILTSLSYANKTTNLSKETVEALHPSQIKMSVSRLESINRCSYQHFANYDLKLQQRRTYALEAPDIGQLFHEALKTITEWIQAEGRDFATLTKDESHAYAAKSMQTLAPVLQHRILSSTNRYQYIQKKLEQVIAQATFILSEQARVSGFSPVGIELAFGLNEELPPVTIPLPNGYEVLLRGRIDRVDKARIGDQLYLRIIDYKSSSRGLELIDVYYGLALQMLTYLNVIISQSERWLGEQAHPAGVLYFHVHHPLLQEAYGLTEAQIDERLQKEFKMKGLIIDEPAVAHLMDTSIESGRSDVAPFGFKKDGSFYSDSHVAKEHVFDLLEHHMYHLIKQAGIQLTSGEIELNPYEYKDQTACTFCEFKSVCQFDISIEGNNFRKLKPLKDDEIFFHMQKERDELE